MLIKSLVRSFKDLIYPPLCLHCQSLLKSKEPLLCNSCLSLLELIDTKERCCRCFVQQGHQYPCIACRQQSSPFTAIASTFDYLGPAATLVKQLKYGQEPYLYSGMAGFLAAQFLTLEWPMPDMIVPIPISFSHHLERGYNQSALLAQGLSKLLKVPVLEMLKRNLIGYSQAGLTQSQRKTLSNNAFFLKNKHHLLDKTILIIDDVMTTMTTLNRAAEVLSYDSPNAIYGLTFCSSTK